jgi:hypothetical protein
MTELTEVFIVRHLRELEDDVQEIKFIGVYSNAKLAQAAIDQIKDQAGFRDFRDGFTIEDHRLNLTGWVEGFSYDED